MKNSDHNRESHQTAAKTTSTHDLDTKIETPLTEREDIAAAFDTPETRAMLKRANEDLPPGEWIELEIQYVPENGDPLTIKTIRLEV